MDRKSFDGYAAPDMLVEEIILEETVLLSGEETFSSTNGFEDSVESDYVW